MDIAFEAVLPAVQSGACDIAMAGLNPTADRKQSVEMSDFYNGGGQCLLVLTENLEKYSTAESLAGEVMATQKGTLQQTLMEEQFPDSEPKLLPKFPQCIEELKNGNCAAVLIDATSAANYVKIYPGISVSPVEVTIDESEAGYSAALMKGNTDLLEWLNSEIAKFQESGELAQWFEDAQAKAEELGVE
jgi:polar amino acid transport system substrate-binding protein